MAQIVPTITAENPHVYREQIERVQDFAKRIHIDLMDGEFTPNTSLSVDQVWFPEGIITDVHLMFQNPDHVLEDLIKLKPSLVIIPAESTIDISRCADKLKTAGIGCGLAVLHNTTVGSIKEKLQFVSHILIFSGNLGHQGGSVAELDLLKKVQQVKAINPDVEIGWDGGVTDENTKAIVTAGVDVVNSGGYIHFAKDPKVAYQTLRQIAS